METPVKISTVQLAAIAGGSPDKANMTSIVVALDRFGRA